MSVTCVIPARGNSVSVNRKAMQLLDGVPLVIRAAELANKIRQVTRVVVSTEDPEIASACRLRGVEVLDREPRLSAPNVPLAEVLADAARFVTTDTILLLQPTCPLLDADALSESIAQFELARASGVHAAYLVVPDPHQFWQDGRRVTPHVNRQLVDASDKCPYRETGVRIVTRAHAMGGGGREGVIELDPDGTALDVDSYDDLALAEAALRRRHVAIQCVASPELGTGHLFRCLRIADALRRYHRVTLDVVDYRAPWVEKLVRSRGLASNEGSGRFPDLLILDTLDLYDSRIAAALQNETPVIALENESEMALRHATVVVNELVAPSVIPVSHSHLNGPKFAVLREEFARLPILPIRQCVKRVLVTYGGSDPANLAQRAANLNVLRDPDIEVRVVQGPAAKKRPKLRDNCVLIEGAQMAEEMCLADLILTSKGRTQYEAAACGTPTLTVAANEREARHYGCPGQVHLGLHAGLGTESFNQAVGRVISSPELRDEMATTARAQVDGLGVERIVWLVNGALRGL